LLLSPVRPKATYPCLALACLAQLNLRLRFKVVLSHLRFPTIHTPTRRTYRLPTALLLRRTHETPTILAALNLVHPQLYRRIVTVTSSFPAGPLQLPAASRPQLRSLGIRPTSLSSPLVQQLSAQLRRLLPATALLSFPRLICFCQPLCYLSTFNPWIGSHKSP
jgi:hypothetical protein